MKTLLVIFAILVIAFLVVLAIGFSDSSLRQNVDVTAIAWRLPETSEKGRIDKSFLISDLDPCKRYYIKEISKDRFIVACPVGSGWIFYNVFTDQKRAFVADHTTVANLPEPVNKEAKSSPQEKEKNFLPEQEILIRDAR